MEPFAPLFILALLGLTCFLNEWNKGRIFYPHGRNNKPFKEYDADGFLTPESYKSHIQYHANGGIEVDLGALFETPRGTMIWKLAKDCKNTSRKIKIDPKLTLMYTTLLIMRCRNDY